MEEKEFFSEDLVILPEQFCEDVFGGIRKLGRVWLVHDEHRTALVSYIRIVEFDSGKREATLHQEFSIDDLEHAYPEKYPELFI